MWLYVSSFCVCVCVCVCVCYLSGQNNMHDTTMKINDINMFYSQNKAFNYDEVREFVNR
jgi:hypothetical protein